MWEFLLGVVVTTLFLHSLKRFKAIRNRAALYEESDLGISEEYQQVMNRRVELMRMKQENTEPSSRELIKS